jgi:threonylcarbamoyladenosine tRNA methylthiotransferase MtaB
VKYAVVTFGCRVNQADSLAIEGQLRAHGAVAAAPDVADLVVVNTCSVTAAADQGARQTIRRIVRANPTVRIVTTGCYATRRPDEVAALPNVVRLVVNTDKDRLVHTLHEMGDVREAGRFAGGDGPCGTMLAPGVAGRTAFTLRVQTGCDERCSYCIIPQTRGASRSRPLGEVFAAIQQATNAGYKEIAITGVHLGSYGRDLGDGTSLPSLVRRLGEWDGDVLFRISSLEPMDCTADIVAAVSASPRLAPHFHLPLQHASDDVLRAMRRPYTAAFYERLVDDIRDRMAHASIGSDVMAGFPGETDRQADELARFLETAPVTHLHVFPYSDRPGAPACGHAGKIEHAVIGERARRLRAIGAELTRRFKASQNGAIRRALVVDDGRAAVTDNYLKLRLDVPATRNAWITVRVEGSEAGRIVGPQRTAR